MLRDVVRGKHCVVVCEARPGLEPGRRHVVTVESADAGVALRFAFGTPNLI